MIDDGDLVGQIEDDVALVRGAREALADRVELEREIIAEGAIEPEMRAFGVAEQRDEGTHRRKGCRLTDALLLGEARLRLPHGERERAGASG